MAVDETELWGNMGLTAGKGKEACCSRFSMQAPPDCTVVRSRSLEILPGATASAFQSMCDDPTGRMEWQAYKKLLDAYSVLPSH